MVVGFLAPIVERNGEITRDQIRELVNQFVITLGELPTEETEFLIHKLEARFDVRLGLGSVISEGFEPWLPARKAQIEPIYWDRYRQYLLNRGFPPHVVHALDDVSDEILGMLGDPEKTAGWARKGLVVGHVQSGKTANYIGLMNKAADAGYRFIVLIAGSLNNLRRQTQERVDEGFVGRDSSAWILRDTQRAAKIGVGLFSAENQPIVLTSSQRDFSIAVAQQVGLNLSSVNVPIVLVIKKNLHSLQNLITWLQTHNSAGEDGIDVPMLLIDDEADYASVNTADAGQDPKRINGLIRVLLSQFRRRVYVGYTATPFANIFINPDTTAEMFGDDLFPKDFIVALDSPTNYFGPSTIFGEEHIEDDLLIRVDDFEDKLPLQHKIDLRVEALPETLLEAIRAFILVIAIRLTRNQANQHNSMLVNVSRFTRVQGEVRREIRDYMEKLKRAIRFSYRMPLEQALRDTEIRALFETFEKHYSNADVTWAKIQPVLNEAAQPIVVVEVNSSREASTLDYRSNIANGLNVIAIGGLALSRGFTLEGLSISYLLRHTRMYDTLLQMARWFGYRDGFQDLCRIFMTEEAISWYAHITEAINELRLEFKKMQALGRTPRDYGLKVRSHPDALLVTAQNKMREAKTIVMQVALAGTLVETYRIHADSRRMEINWRTGENLIRELIRVAPPERGLAGNHLWRNVPRAKILEFLSRFEPHPGVLEVQQRPLLAYCGSEEYRELDNWDVVLVSRASGGNTAIFGGLEVNKQLRTARREQDGTAPPAFLVSGRSSRVASRGLEKEGLSREQIDLALAAFEAKRQEDPSIRNISDKFYRDVRTRPLLMMHPLTLVRTNSAEEEETIADMALAYGISFPRSPDDRPVRTVEYQVNLIEWNSYYAEVAGDDDLIAEDDQNE